MKTSDSSLDSPQEPTPTPPGQTAENGALMIYSEPSAPSGDLPMRRLPMGQKVRRALNRQLRQRGLAEEDLPLQLQDSTLKKSRKGKAGQITLRALSGVQKSPAAQLARKLENELSPSREDLIEKLSASPTAGKQIKAVVEILESQPQFSLARAIVEASADVAQVLDHYAKGALAMKKMETVLELYKEMPHLMRDLMRHALDKEVGCEICFGVGKVTSRANGTSLTNTCPRCAGTGKQIISSDHKEFATTKVLEMSEMMPKKSGALVNVNQAVQVNAGGGSDVLARLSKAADEILYGPRPDATPAPSGQIIDAEVLEEGEE